MKDVKNSYIIAADIVRHTEQQAEYMLLKGLNEKYYEAAVLDLLQQFGQASRSDFDKLLYKKLPDILTDEQKFHKIKNLLQKMKKKSSYILKIRFGNWSKIRRT